MKHIARFLLLVMILSVLIAFSGCAVRFTPKWRSLNSQFMVTIRQIKQQKIIDFEIASTYYLDIKLLGNVEVNDDTQEDIKMEYNAENTKVTYYFNTPKSNTLTYIITPHEFVNNEILKITYNDKTIEVRYNVLDYDFEAHGYYLPNSLSDLDKYPEFKEMLVSVDYYEFTEPYIGISKYEFDVRNDEKTFGLSLTSDLNNPNYASTHYLEYLTDSVYYPAKYDLVLQNPIAHRTMRFSIPEEADTSENAKRTAMNSFSLDFSIIDPCCTNPKYPLQEISFNAENKELLKEKPNDYFAWKIIEPITILIEKYPEKFFKYKIGDITIYVLAYNKRGASAYFEDDTYFYYMSTYYTTE